MKLWEAAVRALYQLLEERDRRYQERFEAQKVALDVALISVNARLDLLNELRQGVATSEQLEALEKLVAEQRSAIEKIQNLQAGGQNNTKQIVAAIGTAVAVIGAIVVVANAVFGA